MLSLCLLALGSGNDTEVFLK